MQNSDKPGNLIRGAICVACTECYDDFLSTDSLGQNESMDTLRIEEAIIFAVGDHWKKVAMVIAKAADALGRDLPSGDEGCEVIAERIEFLIRAGRLEAQGNTKNWRFSEVRRSAPKTSTR